MPNAVEYKGSVYRGGSAVLMARVVGNTGANLVRASVSSVTYTIGLVGLASPNDPAFDEAVSGHDGVSLAVASVVFDSLQSDDLWTRDGDGYNFRHEVDVSSHPAFASAGRSYRVTYRIVPASGQVIFVRFRLLAV